MKALKNNADHCWSIMVAKATSLLLIGNLKNQILRKLFEGLSFANSSHHTVKFKNVIKIAVSVLKRLVHFLVSVELQC